MIELLKFPTHVAKSNNKYKADKVYKINNQGIYNGSLHKHARAIVMRNMKNWLLKEFDKFDLSKLKVDYPVQLILRIHTVINHGSIRWSAKNNDIIWKYPSEEYIPNWDEDNLSTIWIKAIKDALTEYKFWRDDDAYLCRGTDSLVEFVNNIEDRKIVIGFKSLNNENNT